MSRPVKFRKVEFFPDNSYFIPYGKTSTALEEIELKVEELEAMRLKDIEELSQEECAERMQVSRQTFQNIIDCARKKVALALTQGKAISIKGGNYTPCFCRYLCKDCGNVYELKQEVDKDNCPRCGSSIVECCEKNSKCAVWCRF